MELSKIVQRNNFLSKWHGTGPAAREPVSWLSSQTQKSKLNCEKNTSELISLKQFDSSEKKRAAKVTLTVLKEQPLIKWNHKPFKWKVFEFRRHNEEVNLWLWWNFYVGEGFFRLLFDLWLVIDYFKALYILGVLNVNWILWKIIKIWIFITKY